MLTNKILLPLVLVATLLGGAVGCQEPNVINLEQIDDFAAQPEVDFQAALEIAENLLAGVNDNDYEAFARDFSADMRKGITEQTFQEFRSQLVGNYGLFDYIYEVDLIDGVEEGVVNYLFACQFDEGEIIVRIAFYEDGTAIHGVQFGE